MRAWITTVAAALMLGATPAWASTSTGGVHGVITGEQHGQALSGVSVTLRSETSPRVEVRSTDLDGEFEFLDLPAGLYSLEAERDGFERTTRSPLLVVPGREVTEHLDLRKEPVPAPPPVQPPKAS
jgi:hypothetical protein